LRKRALASLLILVAAAWLAAAETELILRDGRVLRGTELRRDGGNYVLTLESGDVITLPVELVEEVVLSGREPPERTPGLRYTEPETLAGRPVDPPRTSEQVEALGPPARFQKGVVDNRWEPESDWDMDPSENNNFNPSTWAEGPVDSNWQPESAWDSREDVMKPGRSTFQKSIIDSEWTPTDSFNNG